MSLLSLLSHVGVEIELGLAGGVVMAGLGVGNLRLLRDLTHLLLWHLALLDLLYLLRLGGKLLRLLNELLLLVGNLLELLLLGKLLLLVLRRRGRGRMLLDTPLVVLRVDSRRVALLAADVLAEDERGDEEERLGPHIENNDPDVLEMSC